MKAKYELRIQALGPMRVWQGERALAGWKYHESKELLLYLLCHSTKPKATGGLKQGQTRELTRGCTKEQIGLALWPDASPTQLSDNLKSRLYDLRQNLGDSEWIIFAQGAYTFNTTWNYWFDVEVFEREFAEAKRLRANAPTQAIEHLQTALELYQGDFLSDLRKSRSRREETDDFDEDHEREWFLSKRDELQLAHADALRLLGQLLVETRQYDPAVEAYRKAIAQDDYDDEAHLGLMRCLAQQGKRSQALLHYRKLVQRRADTPPEAALTDLCERLQRGEELAVTPASVPVAFYAEQKASAPFQAPPTTAHFVGRHAQVESLRAQLSEGALRRFCLVGMGGIGKTTLATQLAHGLRDAFPDGVLWAHISASEPMAILDSWARAYGCDFSTLPDLDSRAAALRGILTDKKVLVILDDVWNVERVRPLLLGGAQCALLFTTRDYEIAAALDAQIITLPVLMPTEGHQLLTNILGRERVHAEAPLADDICALLGHLPLALEIAAHRLVSRPRWTLATMLERLRDQYERLGELQIGDLAVRASFAVSWGVLSAAQRELFAHLAVFEGRAFTVAALAAVARLNERKATDGLDALVALSLLSAEEQTRYRQHPLLADFAREQLGAEAAPRQRMTQHYLQHAVEHRHDYPALEQERDNLLAGLRTAHQQQLSQTVVDYGDVLTKFWFARGYYSEARDAYPRVCAAARDLEDQDAYLTAMLHWAQACIDQNAYAEAEGLAQEVLRDAELAHDARNVASAQFHLGLAAQKQSNFARAQLWYAESLQLREKFGDQRGVAEVLHRQGQILLYAHQKHTEVIEICQRALSIQRAIHAQHDSIQTLRLLAQNAAAQKDLRAAWYYGQEALQLSEETADQPELAMSEYIMAFVARQRGDFEAASKHAEKSIELLVRMGDRVSEAQAQLELSRAHFGLGRLEDAMQSGRRSLQLCQEIEDRFGSVYVMRQLGEIYVQLAQPAQARAMFSEALQVAQALNHPTTDRLKQWLESLSD